MSDPRDPFHSSVSVDERARAMRTFTTGQCIDALHHAPGLQKSTRTALEKRLAKDRKTTKDKEMVKEIDDALAKSEAAQAPRKFVLTLTEKPDGGVNMDGEFSPAIHKEDPSIFAFLARSLVETIIVVKEKYNGR